LAREREFYDRWSATIGVKDVKIDTFFEGSTAPENRFILSRLGNLTGKHILDLGCGTGESSVYFARKGARCVACDWSPRMVEITRKLAESCGIDIVALTVNAMDMDFSDNTFDIVYAANVLHHVDAYRALSEIHRVLKPQGMACTWDPLRHNPLINIYRMIATDVRTKDEHPLDIKTVDTVCNLFSDVEYDTFWLATLWIFLRFFFIEWVNPNKEPYWKKVIYEESRLRRMYCRLERLDAYLKRIPFTKKLAWNIVIVAKK
jgi:ubiquinone/menaquinone biosynthesis C-methylase UbiE